MTLIPASHQDLLTRPLFAHLATIRPDGTPQANPMWFAWDGSHLRFTNTTARRKYRVVVSALPDRRRLTTGTRVQHYITI
jgi:hypothetical protein